MDRDKEIVGNYSDILKMMDRFKKKNIIVVDQEMIVEGEWYLFEREGELPIVASIHHLADSNFTIEKMIKLGYKPTPISMFRKEQTDADNSSDNSR